MDSEKLIYDLLRAPRFASSPDAGHGEAGIIIDPDPVGGGLIVYTATDTYDAELATGTYHFKLGMDGSVSIVNASLTLSGTGSYIAIGATPPTSASAGTGIWIDYTGIYGLASNVKQFYLNAIDGTAYAGAGKIVLDSTGITIQDTTELLRFYNSTDGQFARILSYKSVSPADRSTFDIQINSTSAFSDGSRYRMIAYGSDGDQYVLQEFTPDSASSATTTGFIQFFNDATNGKYTKWDTSSSGTQSWNKFAAAQSATQIAHLEMFSSTTQSWFHMYGDNLLGLLLGGSGGSTPGELLELTDAGNIKVGTTTGTKIGTATTQKLGFYNATPVVRQGAYTQTYSTADKTHANLTAAALTDNSGGTANQTVAAVSGTGDDTTVNNNFADVTAQINKLITDLTDVKQLANSIIDDLQAYGLAA